MENQNAGKSGPEMTPSQENENSLEIIPEPPLGTIKPKMKIRFTDIPVDLRELQVSFGHTRYEYEMEFRENDLRKINGGNIPEQIILSVPKSTNVMLMAWSAGFSIFARMELVRVIDPTDIRDGMEISVEKGPERNIPWLSDETFYKHKP